MNMDYTPMEFSVEHREQSLFMTGMGAEEKTILNHNFQKPADKNPEIFIPPSANPEIILEPLHKADLLRTYNITCRPLS